MTDDEIRNLLADLEGVSGRWHDEKCVRRDRVAQSGGDPDAVDAWVQRVGGRIETYVLASSVPPHRGQQHVPNPLVYIVPLRTVTRADD
ncbi:MAG: hypothetical protein ACRET5_01850 [Steroidobacteraceae bacterium]